ncbi:MAG: HD domain-containing protein [Burkholderiales bacterium]
MNTFRRNDFDVTNLINTTDPVSVNEEVNRIYLELYPDASTHVLNRGFRDLSRLQSGDFPGYRACDTSYHNLQHCLDVTLAMARLMDGYERTNRSRQSLGARIFRFGVVTALFHDIGYLRKVNDTRHKNGAEYTLTHVSRGAKFLEDYMNRIGMAELAPVAAKIIHFTGYEKSIAKIDVPNITFRLIGNMLGTADIIAQMADRCYLEKCRDRLYPEFVEGGLAARDESDKRAGVMFKSAEDLVVRTPTFYRTATVRLNDDLGSAYGYADKHFGGQNLYIEEIDKNVQYAATVAAQHDMSMLRREPPAID